MMDFSKWTPNMKVVLISRDARIRLDNDYTCPGPNGNYGFEIKDGDCDNCEFFMGTKPEKGMVYYVGNTLKACCWKMIPDTDKENRAV